MELFGAGVSKGRQTPSAITIVFLRGISGDFTSTAFAQPPQVFNRTFDESFFLLPSPAFHPSLHLQRLDSALEFLVPYEGYGKASSRVS